MQNIVSANSNNLTMSSREIAEVVESRHDSVKRTIERLAEKSIISFTPSVETSHDGAGARPVEIYRVNKRDSLIVVAQLCPEFTARIVDRWQELEEQLQATALNPANFSRLQLIELAMQAEQERIALEDKVSKIQPMADALVRIAHSNGGRCLTDAAKVLQMPPRTFISKLCELTWIYKRAGATNWIGYQDKINYGYLEHKLTTVERPDGTEKSYAQCLVTPKGIAKLSVLLNAKPMDEAA